MPARSILHVDMDAFYASIEQRDNPALRGKPVAVGGPAGKRGVVAAASYEARRFGVKSAMPTATALQLCPGLVLIPADHARYRAVSRHLIKIFHHYTPLVEPVALDEAYLDVTGSVNLFGLPGQIARQIQQRIEKELDLTASVGAGPNKFIAKLASEYDKPGGLTVVEQEQVDAFLRYMPLEKIWGAGPSTRGRLEQIGVKTAGDLRGISRSYLVKQFGKNGYILYERARGVDERPVVPEQPPKSMGKEITFAEDTTDVNMVSDVLQELAEKVCRRLRKNGLVCSSTTLKLKRDDFSVITRTAGLPEPTNLPGPVGKALEELRRGAWNGCRPVRLAGVYCSRLMPAGAATPSLFPDEDLERQKKITTAVDSLKDKFGEDVVKTASLLRHGGSRD